MPLSISMLNKTNIYPLLHTTNLPTKITLKSHKLNASPLNTHTHTQKLIPQQALMIHQAKEANCNHENFETKTKCLLT